MLPKSSTHDSKLLSLVLRHQPELAGLTLGPGDWVPVAALLDRLAEAGHPLTLDALQQIVAESDEKRFMLSEDGSQVRAAQGHSVTVDLALRPSAPPAYSWHGTAITNLDSIMAEGLRPGARQHVHLSPDLETALKVGKQHRKPTALRIAAGAMSAAGHSLWQADNGVWLTDSVPADFITQK